MACRTRSQWVRITAVICAALVGPGDVWAMAQDQNPQPQQGSQAPQLKSADELNSLVAPIALYPDPLLAQVLAASTYPLEIIQLQQWLEKHKNLKDKALADAVQKEDWDPSIQGLAALPDVVKRMADNIKWTSELGNAFLAQQSEVMDAVQRMRAKAKDTGNLKSNEQVKVETKVVETKNVIVVEQANPQVVYVPSPNPVVVYGTPPPAYPYPSWGYYAAGMAVSFGVGVMMGAFWSGGGWGYGCGWGGHNDVTINNYNNFNRNSTRNTNVNGSRTTNAGNRSSQWQHNPQHRGGTPYGDRATANKFGGTARGDSLSARQTSARQNQAARGDRNVGANRGGGNDRNLGANRGDGAAGGDRNLGANRGASNDRNLGANRGGSSSDRIGNRQVSGGGSRDSSAFSGAGRTSGAQARSSSSRGSSSFSGSRGGGGRGGGGRRR
jgi:hypothetical protein